MADSFRQVFSHVPRVLISQNVGSGVWLMAMTNECECLAGRRPNQGGYQAVQIVFCFLKMNAVSFTQLVRLQSDGRDQLREAPSHFAERNLFESALGCYGWHDVFFNLTES
jgi:hypothetical protein